MFHKHDQDGNPIRYSKAVIDCSDDKIIVEQSHKEEVNINNIVKRHGMDIIQKTAMLQQGEYVMDLDPSNDFTEAMLIVTKAQSTFEQLPSALRKQFNNNPAEYLDFVQNPDNQDSLVKMGLAQRIPEPATVKVEVINSETPPETPPEA